MASPSRPSIGTIPFALQTLQARPIGDSAKERKKLQSNVQAASLAAHCANFPI